MSDKVVQLLANNALCVDRQALAARVRETADRIERGEFGEVDRVCIVVDGPRVDYRVYGRQCNAGELVGLLEWTKARVMGLLP